jgi:hypothetical protein
MIRRKIDFAYFGFLRGHPSRKKNASHLFLVAGFLPAQAQIARLGLAFAGDTPAKPVVAASLCRGALAVVAPNRGMATQRRGYTDRIHLFLWPTISLLNVR